MGAESSIAIAPNQVTTCAFAQLRGRNADRLYHRPMANETALDPMTVDLRSRLPSITAPVTVVYGWSADDRSPRSHIDGLFRAGYRSLRAPAAFERIEGAEHMVMIDQPRRFQAAVERFLR